MVKSSGKVGLFPCILCEPLEESDSDEKTEDSIDSPLSSCAPPNISPPRTPNPMQQQHTVSQNWGIGGGRSSGCRPLPWSKNLSTSIGI